MKHQERLNRAIRAFRVNDLEVAERLTADLLDDFPDIAAGHVLLGTIYSRQKRYAPAIERFEHAIVLDPKNAEALNNLAVIYRQTGDPERAIELVRRAIELEPRNGEMFYNLGNIHKDRGDLDEAIEAYERSIDADPSLAAAYNNLGTLYDAQDRHEEAMAAFERGLEHDPNHPTLNYNLGNTYQAVERLHDARRSYEAARKAHPGWNDAINNLGIVMERLGELEEAEEVFNDLLELEPDNYTARNNLGTVLARSGRIDEAIRAFRTALDQAPQYARAATNLAQIVERGSDPAAARRTLTRMLDQDPDNVRLQRSLAGVYTRSNMHDQAAQMWEKIVAGDSADLDAMRELGLSQYRSGAREAGERSLARYAEGRPQDGSYLADLAGILRGDGFHTEALELAERAVQSNPRDVMGLLRKAEILADLGKGGDARQTLANAAELGEDDPRLLTSRANVHRVLGDREGALAAADELISLQGHRGNADDLSNLNESLELYEQMVNDWEAENAEQWRRNLEKLGRLANQGRTAETVVDMETSEAEGLDEESIPILNFDGGTVSEEEEERVEEPVEDEPPETVKTAPKAAEPETANGRETRRFDDPLASNLRDLPDESDEMPFPKRDEPLQEPPVEEPEEEEEPYIGVPIAAVSARPGISAPAPKPAEEDPSVIREPIGSQSDAAAEGATDGTVAGDERAGGRSGAVAGGRAPGIPSQDGQIDDGASTVGRGDAASTSTDGIEAGEGKVGDSTPVGRSAPEPAGEGVGATSGPPGDHVAIGDGGGALGGARASGISPEDGPIGDGVPAVGEDEASGILADGIEVGEGPVGDSTLIGRPAPEPAGEGVDATSGAPADHAEIGDGGSAVGGSRASGMLPEDIQIGDGVSAVGEDEASGILADGVEVGEGTVGDSTLIGRPTAESAQGETGTAFGLPIDDIEIGDGGSAVGGSRASGMIPEDIKIDDGVPAVGAGEATDIPADGIEAGWGKAGGPTLVGLPSEDGEIGEATDTSSDGIQIEGGEAVDSTLVGLPAADSVGEGAESELDSPAEDGEIDEATDIPTDGIEVEGGEAVDSTLVDFPVAETGGEGVGSTFGIPAGDDEGDGESGEGAFGGEVGPVAPFDGEPGAEELDGEDSGADWDVPSGPIDEFASAEETDGGDANVVDGEADADSPGQGSGDLLEPIGSAGPHEGAQDTEGAPAGPRVGESEPYVQPGVSGEIEGEASALPSPAAPFAGPGTAEAPRRSAGVENDSDDTSPDPSLRRKLRDMIAGIQDRLGAPAKANGAARSGKDTPLAPHARLFRYLMSLADSLPPTRDQEYRKSEARLKLAGIHARLSGRTTLREKADRRVRHGDSATDSPSARRPVNRKGLAGTFSYLASLSGNVPDPEIGAQLSERVRTLRDKIAPDDE